jgi:hypothetical protein
MLEGVWGVAGLFLLVVEEEVFQSAQFLFIARGVFDIGVSLCYRVGGEERVVFAEGRGGRRLWVGCGSLQGRGVGWCACEA